MRYNEENILVEEVITMKRKRFVALAMIFTLLASFLAACSSNAEEITVTLIITAGEDEIFNGPIKLNYENPTVLMLIQEAAILYEFDITLNERGDSIKSIKEYNDYKDENNIDHFWEYKINGVLPENTTGGKANAQPIADGDVIEYVYSTFDPATIAK